MAKAYKNKDGIWCQRFMTPTNPWNVKKRIHVQCTREYNSTTALKELIRIAVEKHMSGKFTTNDTLESYVRERFIVEYPAAKNLKKSSRESLQYLFDKIVLPELGSTPLVSIDGGTVARFAAKLKAQAKKTKAGKERRRYSDQTIRLSVIAIVSVLRWAARLGDLAKRPEIDVPKVEHAHKPKPYTSDETRKLMLAARDEVERALFCLMFDAGMRKSEILGMKWEQVDWTTHVLTIDWQRYRGDERKTKSGRERRFTMTAEVEKALRAIQHLRSQYVFCDADGAPYPEHWMRWVFKRARTKAGLRHTRIHDSRHHFASRCSSVGMSTFDLRVVLGHADVRTTQDYIETAPPLPPSISGAGVA